MKSRRAAASSAEKAFQTAAQKEELKQFPQKRVILPVFVEILILSLYDFLLNPASLDL